MLAYPCLGQWVRDPVDGRLFMRLWAALWWLLVIHAVSSHLLNRKWHIHSREFGARNWLPGGGWTLAVFAFVAFLWIRPALNGIGTFLTLSPLAHLAARRLVEAKMGHQVGGATDAEIEARDFQARLGG